MKRQQSGFTLIELIMVIVILGILSAFAIPKFADLSGNARQASLQGAIAAMKSASAISHAAWLAAGSTGATVQLDGSFISMDGSGYPASQGAGTGDGSTAANAASLALAAGVNADYTVTEGAATLTVALTGLTCTVTYTAATGAVTTAGAECP